MKEKVTQIEVTVRESVSDTKAFVTEATPPLLTMACLLMVVTTICIIFDFFPKKNN